MTNPHDTTEHHQPGEHQPGEHHQPGEPQPGEPHQPGEHQPGEPHQPGEHQPGPGIIAKNIRLKGRVAVDDFALTQGRCVVLCGPNGSGKSSLLRVLGGLLRPESGSVLLDGQDLYRMRRLQIAARLAWLPQRPELGESLPCEAIVAASRYRFGETESASLTRGREILEQHGLGQLIGRLSSQVSGGELQRVLITTLIAQEVPYLLVDEPANHLDPTHQIATYRHLGRLYAQGKGIVIVSHDVRLAQLLGAKDEVTIACMREGRVLTTTTLADPELASKLEEVYRVPFLSQESSGSLAVDLRPFLSPQRASP